MFNVVLYAPRIPQNVGQIARTCLAMDCRLHLVRPLGFRVDTPALKRAAVGYLERVRLTVHGGVEDFWDALPEGGRFWLATKHGHARHTEVPFRPDDWLIFGNETEGLPATWLRRHPERTVCIPMFHAEARCLNLATSVSVMLFEALRQIDAFSRDPNG